VYLLDAGVACRGRSVRLRPSACDDDEEDGVSRQNAPRIDPVHDRI